MAAAGLKIVVPSTPADARGLMVSAIRDPDPVIYLMDVALAGTKGTTMVRLRAFVAGSSQYWM